MMVHIDQFRRGLSTYADREIMSRLPAGTLKRVLVGSAVAIAMQRGLETLGSNPMLLSLGIKTSDNMVDIDLLRDTLREQIPEQGMRVDALGLNMVFHRDDVESIYRYIMES